MYIKNETCGECPEISTFFQSPTFVSVFLIFDAGIVPHWERSCFALSSRLRNVRKWRWHFSNVFPVKNWKIKKVWAPRTLNHSGLSFPEESLYLKHVLDFDIPLGTKPGSHLLVLPFFPLFEKRSWGTEQQPEEPTRRWLRLQSRSPEVAHGACGPGGISEKICFGGRES